MKTYEIRDDGGSREQIQATDMQDAIKQAEDWAREGDWGEDGASVDVRIAELDEDGDVIDEDGITVGIEPDHESLIRAATRYEDSCGTDPDDHEWTYEGEGGCDENPGVWSTGGTSMVFKSHCRKCGLHRTETSTGSQRNPGEHDTVEYRMLDDDEIERHRQNGTMDAPEAVDA